MPGLVHLSLTDAPEIFLTAVSTFGVGFLLWFLVGMLREERRMRARQVHSLVFTGVRALKLEPRDPQGAQAAPTVRRIKVRGEAGKVQVISAPDQRSSKHAVKIGWLRM